MPFTAQKYLIQCAHHYLSYYVCTMVCDIKELFHIKLFCAKEVYPWKARGINGFSEKLIKGVCICISRNVFDDISYIYIRVPATQFIYKTTSITTKCMWQEYNNMLLNQGLRCNSIVQSYISICILDPDLDSYQSVSK